MSSPREGASVLAIGEHWLAHSGGKEEKVEMQGSQFIEPLKK